MIEEEQEDRSRSHEGISTRQQHYVTCELGWHFYFPHRSLPPKVFLSNWLNAAGGSVNAVLDALETASQKRGVIDPAWLVFNLLRKYERAHGVHTMHPARSAAVAA